MNARAVGYRSLTFAALAGAVVGIGALPAALAKDEPVNDVTRYFESLDVAPAVEHRLAVVHPIVVRVVPEKRGEAVRLAGVTSLDLLAFGAIPDSSKPRVETVSFAPEPVVFLTGDVVRAPDTDFVVTRDSVVAAGKPSQVRLMRVSHQVEPDPLGAETKTLGQVLPSALRYLVLSGEPGPAVREACEKWASDVRLTTPRKSPAELEIAESIAKRVADYRKSLASLPVPAVTADQEVVGFAFLLDGGFASMETFGTGALFKAAWPRLLEGIAVEAAFEEAREGLLAEDLADPADPDRFLTDLKKRLLDVFGARLDPSEVPEGARRFDLGLDGAVADALVIGESRVTHFVLVTDPARRAEKKTGESPDPNAAARKARPTEEERRLIERRNGGVPVPAPAPPPAPAPK
jgi:hypothetical protein